MTTETINQLQRNYTKQALAQELFKLRAQVKREEGQDPNIRDAEQRAGVEALTNVTGLSPEEMASTMTKLGVNVNNTLQQVTSKIIDSRNILADLDRACDTKRAELENLFGQEVLARTIGNLIADHDTKKKEFAEKEAELEEQVQRQEAANQRRQAEWEQQFQQSCDRSKKDFEYLFAQQQRQARDTFSEQIKTERRAFDDQQREREREWEIREENVQKREQALATREAEVEGAVEETRKKIEQEKHTALNAMKRDHDHAMQMVQKDATTAAQIASSTINTLQEQLLKQQAEIEQLKTRLTEVQEKNTDLARSALESASHQFALDAVMRSGGANGDQTRTRSGGKA